MASQISTYLKYANLQMAAEAMYGLQTAGVAQKFFGQIDPATLQLGNSRASLLSTPQVHDFVED